MSQIRVAIIGVGNCASSLVQGTEFYSNFRNKTGILNPKIGKYRISDIKSVVAFDIDKRKIEKDISKAIFSRPNVATRFSKVNKLNAPVKKGPILDGYPEHMRKENKSRSFLPSKKSSENVEQILKDKKIDVVINYLPVGSIKAAEFYANAALNADCAFINCMPCKIASSKKWKRKFEERGLPLLGDDIKSQIGATWIHRNIIQTFIDRGAKIDKTNQDNYGGNTDFLNMEDKDRIKTKLESKKSSIEHLIKDKFGRIKKMPFIYAGPAKKHGYKKEMKDRKKASINVKGKGFGGLPVSVNINLDVEDSPNSAAIAIDAIRCAKIALDRSISGTLEKPSTFFFKNPPRKATDSKSIEELNEFINK